MFAGGTVLFDFFQAFDNLFEVLPDRAVDSFAVLFTYLGGYLKLYFCSIGAVGGRLLLVEIPMHQSFRNAQTDELTAAVMGKDKSKRG